MCIFKTDTPVETKRQSWVRTHSLAFLALESQISVRPESQRCQRRDKPAQKHSACPTCFYFTGSSIKHTALNVIPPLHGLPTQEESLKPLSPAPCCRLIKRRHFCPGICLTPAWRRKVWYPQPCVPDQCLPVTNISRCRHRSLWSLTCWISLPRIWNGGTGAMAVSDGLGQRVPMPISAS